ncbi:TonB-dependent receptor [Saccharobesus litoralis]|uniref:TonB-dependent receptor n=1 Tax=Saccharobesus litoralis TaxID=2172099 RepID=A0A2S0VRT4_9ALTE|nr:TonB-dependent receptor [Saccharobesus litoralis]AWB66931.1 TonB-dependent receptor [Saccharobesus litoralis]
MNHFKPNLITMAVLATSLSATQALANEAENDEQLAQEQAQDTEVIEVRGFQRSVIESVNMKRFSDTMVDAITADDLGSLPDLSIADALSRLPGVTSVRNGGQSSELNIRGLSGQYVFSTLNGREQVSSSGGRTVEFSQFPSELITTAQVHKSQKASLIEGGVAGTIDLQTANPLNISEEQKFNLNAQLTSNSRAGDHPDAASVGHRLSLSYQGKFLDETLGVALGVARLFQPSVSTQFVGYDFNYDQVRYDGITGKSDCGNPDTDAFWRENSCLAYSSGFEMMARGGEDVRNGVMSAIVWQPTDELTMKADAFYSQFDSKKWDRGLSVNGLWGVNSTEHLRTLELSDPIVIGNEDNGYSLIGGTYHASLSNPFAQYDANEPCKAISNGKVQAPCQDANGNSGVNPLHITNMADDATTNSEVLTLGFNTTWQNDEFKVSLDLSHSKASEDSFDRTMSILMFEDASAATPKVETDLVMQYQMNALQVPQVNISNAAGQAIDFTDINKMMVTSYSQFPRFEENQADAVRLDFQYFMDNDFLSSLEAGVRASKRTHTLERGVWSYGGPGHFEDGQHLNKRSWDDMRAGNYIVWEGGKEKHRFAPYQLSADEVTVVDLGGEFSSLPSFLAIDNEAILDKWLVDSQGNPLSREAVDVWDGADWTITNDRDITEKVTSAFFMANIDTTVFDMPLTGNIGVRWVETEQTAFGVTPAPSSREFKRDADGNIVEDKDGQQILETIETGDPITDDVGKTEASHRYTQISHKFDNILPSLNLSLGITDNDYIKFAVARVMARPDMAQMAVSGNYNYQNKRPRDGKNVVNVDMTTSPYLEPFLATQVDLSFEHYFAETDGNLFIALYNKDIESFTDTTTIFDFDFAAAGIELPETNDSGQAVEPGDLSVTVNNEKGGYVRGYEIGYTQTFKFLPGAWSGLGFTGSYSHTESEIQRTINIGNGQGDVNTPIEGLSPNIYSFTLFYNYEGIIDTYLNARHREGYLGRQIATGQDQSAYFTEETILDYQVKYSVNDNLNVTLSINNLTDEANRSYFGDKTKTGTIQYFGRNYFLGMNYSF